MSKKEKSPLLEVLRVFSKLGCIGFGGPAAHIAMMQDEVVSKRKWMKEDYFLDLIGATNLIPGPNSTEMTMHCGHERAGWPGLVVAGIAFVLPATLLTGILAWLYTTYGQLPEIQPYIYGIKPMVLAIIAAAVIKLGKKAIKNMELAALGLLVLAAALFGMNEISALLTAGILGTLYFSAKKRIFQGSIVPFLLVKASVPKIFLSFLKVGALLYGSGYVLFAYLDAELVATGLLSEQQLIDAIAVGQLTPGPVLSTATFIGYQLDGIWGAVAATVGIFLPSFLFVGLLKPLVPKMRQSKTISYFLDAVNAAAVAVMGAVLFKMGAATLVDWRTLLIGLLGFVLVFGLKKLNSGVIVLIGASAGYLLYWI